MTSVATVPVDGSVRPAPVTREEQRLDIEALRALAVSLVLVYHLWPGWLPGGFTGVDVFFVISGFLITTHLLRRPPHAAGDLAAFWARRVRRLLPASLLVLLVTVVLTWVLGLRTLWETVAQDAIASALYVQNWALADRSVDYLAAEQAPSPFQHYWSLSVEEQFYLGWPVLIALAALVARRLGQAVVPMVAGVLTVTVVSSFVCSLVLTSTEPARAYFVTPTRIWELGVGGLLAVWALRRRSAGRLGPPGSSTRVVLAWAGLVAIVGSAFSVTASTPFPGWMALAPVAGTAAVIAAAVGRSAASPLPLMARPVVQRLGGVSYGVYLWHWPLITLVPYVSAGSAGLLDKLAVIAASLVLAHLTKRFVEDPVRFRAQPSLRGTFGVASVATGLVVAAGAILLVQSSEAREDARAEVAQALEAADSCVGASAMAPGAEKCGTTTSGPVLPGPSEARQDRSDAYTRDCWENRPWTGTRTCTFGAEDANVSIALVGNSHAGHWLPALQELADEHRWRITTYLASECPATARPAAFSVDADTRACVAWGRRVIQATAGSAYDLVVTSERSATQRSGSTVALTQEELEAGYESYLSDWLASGTRLVLLRDTPVPGRTIGPVPECVQQFMDDLLQCSATPDEWTSIDPLVDAARDLGLPEASIVDPTSWFCREDLCPAVIGGVVVYADEHHMTATYARTMAPALEGPLTAALGGGA